MRRFILLLLMPLIMAGCATTNPSQLGISPKTWHALSSERQNEIINNSYQVKVEQAAFRSGDTDSNNPVLEITLRGGEMMMPPFVQYSHYEPVSFSLQEGACSDVYVYDTDKTKAVELIACYHDRMLYLDPSQFDLNKQPGTVKLVYSPIWKRGFTYRNISSSGYARLRHVNVHVKQVELHDSF